MVGVQSGGTLQDLTSRRMSTGKLQNLSANRMILWELVQKYVYMGGTETPNTKNVKSREKNGQGDKI